jgi:hypothetical protein
LEEPRYVQELDVCRALVLLSRAVGDLQLEVVRLRGELEAQRG